MTEEEMTEEEMERSIAEKEASMALEMGLDGKPEDVKELVHQAIKRFKWVIGFMGLNDPFNYEVLSRMNYVVNLKTETMGVAPHGITIDLVYNPIFVSKLTDPELRWALSHEVLHIVLHHVTKRAPALPSEMKLHNYGADFAINSMHGSTPDRCYPHHHEDKVDGSGKVIAKKGEPWVLLPAQQGFPEKLSMEQYIFLLQEKYKDKCPNCGKAHKSKEEQEQQPGKQPGGQEGAGDQPGDQEGAGGQQGEGGQPGGGCGDKCECEEHGAGGMGDHSGWDKSEMADSQIREWVRGIESSDKWGNTSAELREQIRSAQKSEVPWTSILKHYYGQISTTSTRATYKRPSRRMWYPWSGRVRECVDKKLVGVDTSGSVSSNMLGKFLAETNKLAATQPVDLITWDINMTMKKAVAWERKHLNFAFSGRGGTDPQPCLDYAKENGYKEVIMLTDGYFEKVTKPAGLHVLWVITPDGTTENLPFGTIIKMKEMPGR